MEKYKAIINPNCLEHYEDKKVIKCKVIESWKILDWKNEIVYVNKWDIIIIICE